MQMNKLCGRPGGRRSPIYRGTVILNLNIQGRSCHAEPFASLRVNSAKHLCAHRERPFASLRVTTIWAAAEKEDGSIIERDPERSEG